MGKELDALSEKRIAEFDAYWNEFKKSREQDLKVFSTQRVLMCLPIEAMRDWSKGKTSSESSR